MPHICLWEMAEIFRGDFRLAFRRFSRGAVRAHLEGLQFDVYYFSPRQVLDWFGSDFELIVLEGLSVPDSHCGEQELRPYVPAPGPPAGMA